MEKRKQTLQDFAILGGARAFTGPLHVGRPNIGQRQKLRDRWEDILDRRWLTNAGRYVTEFEAAIAARVGVKHCIAMCNGTVALEIAIRAADLKGEVILPAFTFVATAHALQWQEITPVFADIDPLTHNVNPASVEKMITPRTTGIIGVHLWGRACNVEALERIARTYNLKLLFDAAHAIGCSYQGQSVGSFGNAEVLSFHATKVLNTLEGGAVVTNDDDLARRIRLMKNFGFTNYDTVEHIGTNGKMNEMSAAMGLTNLESFDDFVTLNRRHYECYKAELKGVPGLALTEYDSRERNNYHYVILEVDEAVTGISRDTIYRILHAENILARRYFYPGCHRMEPYKSYFPHAGLLLPETERMCRRVLSIPTGGAVTREEVLMIADMLRMIVAHGPEMAGKLAVLQRS